MKKKLLILTLMAMSLGLVTPNAFAGGCGSKKADSEAPSNQVQQAQPQVGQIPARGPNHARLLNQVQQRQIAQQAQPYLGAGFPNNAPGQPRAQSNAWNTPVSQAQNIVAPENVRLQYVPEQNNVVAAALAATMQQFPGAARIIQNPVQNRIDINNDGVRSTFQNEGIPPRHQSGSGRRPNIFSSHPTVIINNGNGNMYYNNRGHQSVSHASQPMFHRPVQQDQRSNNRDSGHQRKYSFSDSQNGEPSRRTLSEYNRDQQAELAALMIMCRSREDYMMPGQVQESPPRTAGSSIISQPSTTSHTATCLEILQEDSRNQQARLEKRQQQQLRADTMKAHGVESPQSTMHQPTETEITMGLGGYPLSHSATQMAEFLTPGQLHDRGDHK